MSTDCCLTQAYYTWKGPDMWPCDNGRAPHCHSGTSETDLSHQFLPVSKQYTPLLEIKQLFGISLSILAAVLRESQLHKTHLAQQRGSLYHTSSTAHMLHTLAWYNILEQGNLYTETSAEAGKWNYSLVLSNRLSVLLVDTLPICERYITLFEQLSLD